MVHQYKLNGYNIVLDTCSGGVHVVDEVAYDIIALIREKSADEIEAYRDVESEEVLHAVFRVFEANNPDLFDEE